MDFGETLRLYREARGMTIRDVAREIDRGAKYCWDIEHGNIPPKPHEREKLVRRLGMPERLAKSPS